MTEFFKNLLRNSPIVLDGAWGTQLQNKGLEPGEIPDIWNLIHPDKVYEVAKAYVDAGSRIILTNTFGANKIRLSESLEFSSKVKEINKRGVEISKSAADGKAYVFASIGPSGKLLMSGDVTEEELFETFKEQAQAMADAGADGIVIETMSDIVEAVIAVKAAKTTGLPLVACMVFDSGKAKDRTMMGNTPEECAEKLLNAGVDVVGSNCGQGIETFLNICKRLHDASLRQVWIKPNAGLPTVVDGKTIYKTTPEEFARFVPDLINAGAGFIGGCCGTNPEFIVQIRKVLSGS
ncbi:MAG TPA: homocysteine S-methyltransferase family protein [Verrucomicrobiota bacterium]|nr:homocysteine S-methyltransferase family protein [Verrucomicrobiota bacterium]